MSPPRSALDDYKDMLGFHRPVRVPQEDEQWSSLVAQARRAPGAASASLEFRCTHTCWFGCFDKWHIDETEYRAGRFQWKERT